jgi:peptidoglycan/LPS O-acetylase OafA/YrhL
MAAPRHKDCEVTLLKEGLIIFGALLVPALILTVIVRRFVPARFREESRQHADPVWAIAGGAFGLLLGFMVVLLWEDLQEAQAAVQAEASDLVNLYELSFGLPASANPEGLRGRIVAYVQSLVDEEWDALGRHQADPGSQRIIDQIWRSYVELEPSIGSESISYGESITRLEEIQEARDRRINAATNRVPGALWAVLLGGVALIVAMACFTGSDDREAHLLTVTALVVSLAAVLFLIRIFNNPFQGHVRADPEPMERALEHFAANQ